MIENFFLSMGFSFTLAKLIPYILSLILGLLIVLFMRKRLRFKSKVLNSLVRIIAFAIPFGVYFAICPIYEGDFANGGSQVARSVDNEEISGDRLVVISIPYCPYCKEAMERMKVLKKRNPDMTIEYVVCSSDSSTLDFYQETSDGKIEVRLAQKPVEMSVLAGGQFPTFVLSEENKALKRWSNSRFGVRALDEAESVFK